MILEMISWALIFQLFVLINPLSSFPVLMEAYKKKMNVKAIAVSAVLTAFAIAIVIAFIGPSLFGWFGVTVDSFRIAGGVVLLLLGLDTIRDKEDKVKVNKVDSLISIIATPLLTGPATISFVTIKAFELGRVSIVSNLIFAFILVGLVFYIFSVAIPKVNAKVVNIMSKVMGLFLTAVAIEMIANGIMHIIGN